MPPILAQNDLRRLLLLTLVLVWLVAVVTGIFKFMPWAFAEDATPAALSPPVRVLSCFALPGCCFSHGVLGLSSACR
jgi:hypothetical protein